MKLLVLASRRRKPSYRFRIGQFIPGIEREGFSIVTYFLARRRVRFRHVLERAEKAEIVLIQKRLLRKPYLQKLRRRARRLVFDFDDAIWCKDDGTPSIRLRRRFERTVRAVDQVVAGNSYLAEVARECGATRVAVIPTVVDTNHYSPAGTPRLRLESDPFVFGWLGSASTNAHLGGLLPELHDALEGDFNYLFHAVSGSSEGFHPPSEMPFRFSEWTADSEVAILRSFDVGIMPIPDTTWTRGKCGMKALLYMASGVPCVLSPVGANREIVVDGESGFFAGDAQSWGEVLSRLAQDESLCRQIGSAGRTRVQENWSIQSAWPRFRDALGLRSVH